MNSVIRSPLYGLALAAALLPGSVHAWPDKPITVIIPYAAGSSADTLLRQLSPEVSQRLGATLIVQNTPGASGIIGTRRVVQAPADGYTLLLGAANNFLIDPLIYKDLNYDPRQALTPVLRLFEVPTVIATNTRIPAKDISSFQQHFNHTPQPLNYGSPGVGTTVHLASQTLTETLSLSATHIPFNGVQPVIMALAANDIQLMLGSLSAMQSQISSGRLQPLAVIAKQRLAQLPDVATLREQGIDADRLNNWWMLAAPRQTPPEIVARIQVAFQQALAGDSISQHARNHGLLLIDDGPAPDLEKRLKEEADYWEKRVSLTLKD